MQKFWRYLQKVNYYVLTNILLLPNLWNNFTCQICGKLAWMWGINGLMNGTINIRNQGERASTNLQNYPSESSIRERHWITLNIWCTCCYLVTKSQDNQKYSLYHKDIWYWAFDETVRKVCETLFKLNYNPSIKEGKCAVVATLYLDCYLFSSILRAQSFYVIG